MSDSPLHCLACGYDVSGTLARCPECGVEISVSDREVMARRGELMIRHTRVRTIVHRVVAGAAAACVMTATSLAASNNSPLMACVFTIAALSATIGGSLLTSEIIPRVDQTPNGNVVRAAWERLLPVLHFSWMSIPVFAVLLLFFAWATHRTSNPQVYLYGGMKIAVLLCAIWGVLTLVAIFYWSKCFNVFCDSCGCRTDTRTANIVVLVSFLFFTINAAIGFAGGIFGTIMIGDLGESLGWFAPVPAISPNW